MLFNSLEFLIFFPLVTILYWLLPHRFRWFHLLLASCIFYAAFIPAYILILFATIIVDYFAGIYIAKYSGKQRKKMLLLSIVANVGILAVFKYYNFFISNVNNLLFSAGIETYPLPLLNIILPIGLSFHTFQAMSYTIEVYRGRQESEKHFGIYALYVMFYPQLVAGPIERPQNLLHQFHEKHYFNSLQFTDGIRLMLWGAVKKTVIADRLAIYVNAVYNHSSDYHYGNLAIATFFFAIQIYCDFSGYSDIAIGSARTMGFDLMTNFNRPYFSRNIQEFWKRWHISLSSWFRDYVYIPMGGNKIGIKRMYLNVAVVFLISGFWHGANWTFIIWGALHALYTIVYMLKNDFMRFKLPRNLFIKITGWAITFILVCIAWIFFRASSLNEAFGILYNILSFNTSVPFAEIVTDFDSKIEFGFSSVLLSLFMILFMFAFEALTPSDLGNLQKETRADIVFLTLALVAIICLGVFNNTSFIYFQF